MSDPTELGIAYRYVGEAGAYVMGVPARDLTEYDVWDVGQREGIDRGHIEASGLYEPVDWVEVPPFCGARTADGGRCRHRVAAWGERCWQHE